MWPFENRHSKNSNILKELSPGESALCSGNIPKNVDRAVIKIDYGDKFGNKYQTLCTIDFTKRKVISQEYKIVKKVKDMGDEIPKLVIDEDNINWTDFQEKNGV